MLVLKRRVYEKIRVGDDILIEVIDVSGGTVSLAVTAPKDVRVDREEVAVARVGGDGKAVAEEARRRRREARIVGRDQLT